MRVVSEETLEWFRKGGPCQWCHRGAPRRHPHHLISRGMGGGTRLDLTINLVALCPVCHGLTHQGQEPCREDLLAVVATRYSLLQPEVLARLYLFVRAPKTCRLCHCCEGVGWVNWSPSRWHLTKTICGVCRGSGILDRRGGPWLEEERMPTWQA